MRPWLSPIVRRAGWLLLFGLLAPARPWAYQLPPASAPRTSFASDDDFLDYVGRRAFNYFWATQNPTTGLIPDRASNPSISSIAATGFGLSVINTAVDRGWITRAEGRTRVFTTLRTLASLPQGAGQTGVAGYRGWFYHFLDANTGLRAWNSELSTIDTALLMMGVHDCGLFYDDSADPDEAAIRRFADHLLNGLDWNFALRADNRITMSWDPVTGYNPNGWSGHNEALCLYLLGLGAATNPLPPASWTAWTSSYPWRTYLGQSYVWTTTGSLFTYQYSHCWIDFRGITDAYLRTQAGGIDYAENSRRATLSQQAYALTRPFANYGAAEFGITACDGPNAVIGGVAYAGYEGRGAPPGPPATVDDGTLAPSAVLGSLPFAPEVCLPAARRLYDTYVGSIWSDYGFCDAFNITAGRWFDPDVVGIDAGPSVLMIDNHRGGGLWRRMLASPVLQRGLQRAGFTAPPPDQVAATASADGKQVQVTWSSRSTYETGFQVEISLDGVRFSTSATTGPGAASATLSAQPGSVYSVRVRTMSAAGLSGFRQTVQVTTPAAVVITAQPPSLVVASGQTATLTASATGSGTLAYQWSKGGTAISGATADFLTLSTVSAADAGSYTVTVSNASGSTTSQPAVVTVIPRFFSHPAATAADAYGNLYVADAAQHIIQRVSTSGEVSLVAGGSGLTGATDGTGDAARFNQPGGVAALADGTLYVADTANAQVRRISPAGVVTTLAGSAGTRGHADGTGPAATFNQPQGLALDTAGNLFVADSANHVIRRVTSGGAVSTVAGTPGVSGYADGTASAARFNNPTALAVDGSGNVYVADTNNAVIRRITPAGFVSTLAGLAGVSSWQEGIGSGALFNRPGGLALDAAGNLWAADTGNSALRVVSPVGVVTTVAGLPAVAGLRDGPGSSALFNQPLALSFDSAGNLWIADTGNALLRRVTAGSTVATPTLVAGTGGGGTTPPPPPPPASGGGGGGGGAVGPAFLALLVALAGARRLRSSR